MDVGTLTEDLKVIALAFGTVPKPGKPDQGNDDGPAIGQVDR